MRPILDNLASFVAPGLVLLLLGIQVAFGLRGFDRPDDNMLQVLQVPGVLLGWGGVALLMPLLVWMVLDWWGYDLGGFALKGLGSAVLGIATGALCGLIDDVAAGGIVGGGLAGVLRQTVGPNIAFAVLGLMAIPAAILAFSLQKRAARPQHAVPTEQAKQGGQAAKAHPKLGFWAHVRGVFGGKGPTDPAREAWYPERRFDAAGNEVPMDLTRERDVGGIRFVDEDDEDEDEDAVTPTAPAVEAVASVEQGQRSDLLESEERLPTIPELLAGNYRGGAALARQDPSGGLREPDTDVPADGPVHVDSEGRPLPAAAAPTWSLAAEEEPVLADSAPDNEVETTTTEEGGEPERVPVRDVAGQQTLSFVPTREPQTLSEPSLPAGVRWADEPAPPEPAGDETPEDEAAEDEPADLPALSAALEHAVRGPAADPADVAHTSRSVRETLRQKVEAIRSDSASSRYMAKLEAIGLFDSAEPGRTEDAKGAKNTKGSAKGAKSASAKSAKKKASRKKVAKRKVAKKAAKKTARRTSPATRAPARKKVAVRRKPKVDPAATAAAAAQKRREALLDNLRSERLDPLFTRAVETALDRGAASPVLLTRRLGLPFARAKDLIDRMIATGVLEDVSPSGSHALLLSAEDWAQVGTE